MRRGLRRLFRRSIGGAPPTPPVLQYANQLMAAGKYKEAAAAFEDLAKRAEGLGGPRAPFLFLQAGRAYILLREYARGMVHLKHGLILMANSKHYSQLYHAGTRVAHELSARKLDKEASEIRALIRAHTPAFAEMPTDRMENTRPALPTHCPTCGGPMRSDEVEWIDETTVECSFCGSPVRAGH